MPSRRETSECASPDSNGWQKHPLGRLCTPHEWPKVDTGTSRHAAVGNIKLQQLSSVRPLPASSSILTPSNGSNARHLLPPPPTFGKMIELSRRSPRSQTRSNLSDRGVLVPGDARYNHYGAASKRVNLDAKQRKRRAPPPATPSDFWEGA
jgi:hypothetical protein